MSADLQLYAGPSSLQRQESQTCDVDGRLIAEVAESSRWEVENTTSAFMRTGMSVMQ